MPRTDYRGVYSLPASETAPAPSAVDAVDALASVLSDFGFTRDLRASSRPDEAYWDRDVRKSKVELDPELARLAGADAFMTVAVGGSPVTVVITDWSDYDETEFVRALKARIEQRLVERFGVARPTFIRVRWAFFNS